jgi:ABC-type glycerol-3-phosphate transport system substrate-binding protein
LTPEEKEGATMKKILSVVALIAISASLVACGGEKKEAAPAEAPAVVEEPAPATTETTTTTTTETAPAPTTGSAPAPAN